MPLAYHPASTIKIVLKKLMISGFPFSTRTDRLPCPIFLADMPQGRERPAMFHGKDPTRRMNSRLSDGGVCGLTLHRVL